MAEEWSYDLEDSLTPDMTASIVHMFDDSRFTQPIDRVDHVEAEMTPYNAEHQFCGPSRKFKLSVRASNFANAGLGVFAEEEIPEAYCFQYKGDWIPVDSDSRCSVSDFRWTIFKWDKTSGKQIVGDKTVMGYVDGKNMESSNWSRYINTAVTQDRANIEQWQSYNKCFLGTKRTVLAREELLAFYGAAFVKMLGLSASDN